MKITLLLFLSVCIISVSILNVSATSNNILDKETAQELVYEAYEFFFIVHCISPDAWWDNFQTSHTTIEINGQKCTYVLSDQEGLPGGSYMAMQEYAKTIYTEELVPLSYDLAYSNDVPLYKYIDGDLYVYIENAHIDALKFFKNNKIYGEEPADAAPILDVVYSDNAKATAYVYIGVRQGREEEPLPAYIKCEFINTVDGWRISQSDFSDMLLDGKKALVYVLSDEYQSPSTGDPAFDSFVILPVISLACLTPAVYLLRRRRRRSVI